MWHTHMCTHTGTSTETVCFICLRFSQAKVTYIWALLEQWDCYYYLIAHQWTHLRVSRQTNEKDRKRKRKREREMKKKGANEKEEHNNKAFQWKGAPFDRSHRRRRLRRLVCLNNRGNHIEACGTNWVCTMRTRHFCQQTTGQHCYCYCYLLLLKNGWPKMWIGGTTKLWFCIGSHWFDWSSVDRSDSVAYSRRTHKTGQNKRARWRQKTKARGKKLRGTIDEKSTVDWMMMMSTKMKIFNSVWMLRLCAERTSSFKNITIFLLKIRSQTFNCTGFPFLPLGTILHFFHCKIFIF